METPCLDRDTPQRLDCFQRVRNWRMVGRKILGWRRPGGLFSCIGKSIIIVRTLAFCWPPAPCREGVFVLMFRRLGRLVLSSGTPWDLTALWCSPCTYKLYEWSWIRTEASLSSGWILSGNISLNFGRGEANGQAARWMREINKKNGPGALLGVRRTAALLPFMLLDILGWILNILLTLRSWTILATLLGKPHRIGPKSCAPCFQHITRTSFYSGSRGRGVLAWAMELLCTTIIVVLLKSSEYT